MYSRTQRPARKTKVQKIHKRVVMSGFAQTLASLAWCVDSRHGTWTPPPIDPDRPGWGRPNTMPSWHHNRDSLARVVLTLEVDNLSEPSWPTKETFLKPSWPSCWTSCPSQLGPHRSHLGTPAGDSPTPVCSSIIIERLSRHGSNICTSPLVQLDAKDRRHFLHLSTSGHSSTTSTGL